VIILSVSLSLEREREIQVVRAFFCRPIEVWAGAESLSSIRERVGDS
jgi:hypothetical protein